MSLAGFANGTLICRTGRSGQAPLRRRRIASTRGSGASARLPRRPATSS